MIATGLRKRKNKHEKDQKKDVCTITTTQDRELPCAVDAPRKETSSIALNKRNKKTKQTQNKIHKT